MFKELPMTIEDKIKGSVFGLAYGDAYGWPVEFRSYDIAKSYPETLPNPAIITDDTQMSLYALKPLIEQLVAPAQGVVGELFRNNTTQNENAVRKVFAESFIEWLHDPKNNRAPGINCIQTLTDLENTEHPVTWLEGTSTWSKGCGANMRNPWFGLTGLTMTQIANLSVIQSSVTHNNPWALASAAVTAVTTEALLRGHNIVEKVSLYDVVEKIVNTLLVHEEERRANHELNRTVEIGYNPEYLEGLEFLSAYFMNKRHKYETYLTAPETDDICEYLGLGKIAEEALILAVAAFDKYRNEPLKTLTDLAHSEGDSDSIAAIGGAFIGAYYGFNVFPAEWENLLEPDYLTQLNETVESLTKLH
jgi:ADP-ribosylglycohydrolase